MKTWAPLRVANQMHRRGPKGTSALPGNSIRHLEKALRKEWKQYRKELKRCQDKFSEKAIHAIRVETRRMLSTLELLSGLVPAGCVTKVQRTLKKHRNIFDELRDTQVQLLMINKMRRVFRAARPFHSYLVKREARLANEARRRIQRVKTKRLGRLIGACREQVEAERKKCGPEAAAALLTRPISQAFARTKQLRARIHPSKALTIHRTRIAFKKFRYMVEQLADYWPSATDELLAAMHHYQTMMGDIQDAEVLLAALDKFIRKQEIEPRAASGLREELARRRQWLIRVYLDAAGQLEEFWPPN